MAGSPGTAALPDNAIMGSPPPSSPSPNAPPLQGNPSLPADAPPEPSPPDHATPIPPPSPGRATEGRTEADELLTSPPLRIDGTPGAAGPPPSFSSLEAAALGRPSSRSLLPPTEAVEFYSEAASSPSSSYETADDASPASPPPTPPPLVLCASPDSYFTEPAEMASPEREPMDADEGSTAPEPPTPPLESGPGASSTVPAAMASPARDPMGADEGSHTAPEPPTPPLESGPEGFEQQPHPPPTTPPECDSSGPVELPFPPTSPVEIAHTLPDAAEIDAVAGTSEKAPGSTTAMEVTDATEIDAVAGTPEKAPGSTAAMEVTDATEIDKVTRKPEQAPDSTAAMEVTDATEIDAVAGTPEEAPGSTVAMEVTYGETGTAAVSVSPVLESREEGSLQESTEKPSSPTMNTETVSMQRPSSPTMDTEPCLPEMAPLGFQQQQQQPHPPPTTPPECDSSEPAELPLPPTSLADIAHTLPDAAEVNVVAVMPEVAPGSTVVMEVTYREIDTTAVSVLPVLESREEGSLEESTEKPSSPTMNTETVSMRRPSSPTMDTEPCLTEMAPLGFQQQQQKPHPPPTTPPECVSSEPVELPLPPTSLADIAHTLPDAAEVNVVAVMPEEAPGSTVVMEVTYREIDTTAVSVPPVLESGEEGSLQESMQRPSFPAVNTEPESMQRPSSPTMDTEPCLPEMATLEFQQQQQQPHPPPTASPECDSLRHVELPLPPTSLAEIAHTLPDAAEIDVVAGTPEEAPGSTLAMTVTYRETDTTAVSVPLVVECGKEGSLQESMQRPSSPIMVTESCSREMEPPGFENCKASWLPVPPSTPPGESISSLPVAGASKGLVVMPEEAVDSVPSSEALDAEKPPTSPDMPPPGFENFKSSWLQLPTTPPVETTDVLPDVVVTKAVEAPIEEVSGPLPALEVTNMETDTVLNILPTEVLPTEGTEWLLQQPPLKPPSPVGRSEPCSQDEMAPPGFENFKSSSEPCSAEEMPPPGFDNFKSSSEPCSPEEMAPPGFENLKSSSEQCLPEEMAPPGFENFKSSWPPLPSLPQTAYALPDGAATDALAVTVEEAAGPPPAIEAMNVDMDAIHPPPLPFDSGVEGSLQEPPPRVSSPIMQEASCSPDRAPPGFETYKSSQLLLPSPTLAQTTNVRQDQLVTEAVSVIEEAPQPLHSVEVMSANMDTAPPLLLLSESGPDGPFPRQLPCLPPAEKGTTTCLPDMAHSGCDDLEPSQLLPPPAVISPVQTPDGLADVPAVDRIAVASEESPHRLLVSGGMEDGTVPIQSSPLENASEGSLPQVESQVHSPTAQAVDSLLDAPGSKSVAVTSEEMSQPPLASQATNTDLVSTTTMQPQSEGIVDESLQPQHPPSSIAHAAPCLQDSVSLVPQPPSPFLNKDIGQMVCGSCRVLLAYFRGAGHVHCTCCQTMNLVLEAHEVGNVHCGRCETLLMYPFGAPAVKCSRCLFVTEIGERNVRPRLSKPDQAVPPHQTELAHQG